MTVNIVDKRGQNKPSPATPEQNPPPKGSGFDASNPPPWFPVFVAFEAERLRQLEKWGNQNGKRLDGTGDSFFVGWADEYKRQNDERHALGKPGVWSKILLEEVFEAMSEPEGPELVKELIQAGAVVTAWLEDLASRGVGVE